MVETFEVSDDEAIYESFPDVALTETERLVCVFSECTHHGDRAYTNNVVVISEDRGRTWSEKRPLTDPRYEAEDGSHWDCPRISRLADGRLVAVVNEVAGDTPDRAVERNFLLFSDDGGTTWTDPRETPVEGIVPDQLVELDDGTWVLAAHTVEQGDEGDLYVVRAWLSDDEGASWTGPATVAADPDLALCEASVVELPEDDLVCFMRENSGTGRDAYKAISHDGGETWDGPYRFPLPGCHRPVAGLLDSGDVLVTHRFMQGGSGWLGSWTQNTFAALTDPDSCLAESRNDAWTRILPLEYDRSPSADTGYTGWVQFDDGEIYVVNYVVDDAPSGPVREPEGYDGEYDEVPKAHIRGYALDRSAFVVEG